MNLEQVAILIPAWQPDANLVALVERLSQSGFTHIVVVNDGSGPLFDPVFTSVTRIAGVEVLRHDTNRGKGAALRTGISHVLRAFPEAIGIVTADADGQHLSTDILRVAETLLQRPEALVLGSRAFEGDVPLRSHLGNTVTRHLAGLVLGADLRDTQTGLRGIPASFARSLLDIKADGYEFELAMLIAARQASRELIEEPIRTVYEPGNSSSHFNPLKDSLKISAVLLRFASLVLAATLLDVLLFRLVWRLGGTGILTAQVAAGTLAGAFNYWILRRGQPGSQTSSALRFFTLSVARISVSSAWILLLFQTGQLKVWHAKIAVESLLFLVNFALQRDWVFRVSKSSTRATIQLPSWRTAPLWLLLVIPAAIEVFGFRSAHLLAKELWLPEGIQHFSRFVTCALATAVLFGVFARRWFLPVAGVSVLLCSVWAVGVAPVGAVLLFVFSATVLGRLVFGSSVEAPLAMLAGSGLWIVAICFTAHLPLHYAATYLVALVLPLALGFRHTRRLAAEGLLYLRPGSGLSPSGFLPVALLAFVLIANWLVVLKPEVSADGLAMHLAIPADIALHHAYTIDFRHFIWALMPMGADFLYSVVYMLGGEYAARLLNFAMLAGTALLLLRSLRSFLSSGPAALLTALFVSSPMVYLVTGSMFVENFVAFMVLGSLVALWRFYETRAANYLMLTAVLTGASMALKLGALAVALPVFVVMLMLSAGVRRRPLLATLAIFLTLAFGSIPYATAWWQTGNPFFPFQTGPFKSSFVGDIRDRTFNRPISWQTPFDLTFKTDRYFEGLPGSFGFQYLLFLPLIVVGAGAVKSFRSRTAILLGGISALVIAATQPNARYFYFTTPLLTVGIASSLAWLRSRDYRLFQAMLAAAALVAFANIWVLPSADWYNRGFYSSPLFSRAGRDLYLHGTSPIREVIAWINRNHPDRPVAITDASDIAGLIPPVYTNHWHDYSFSRQITAAEEPAAMLQLFRQAGIRQMIVVRDRYNLVPGTPQDSLSAVISLCGRKEFESGSFAALELRPDCEAVLSDSPLGTGQCPEEPLLTNTPKDSPDARIDETDPRIGFFGRWTRSNNFPQTWKRSISYANGKGAQICMSIQGTGLDYFYTRADNRGLAEILVDGRHFSVVDLYSPTVEWQSKTTISGLTPGRHDVAIRVLHRKDPAATDYYVDLDAVRIF